MKARPLLLWTCAVLLHAACETTRSPAGNGVDPTASDEISLWNRSREEQEGLHRAEVLVPEAEVRAYLEHICHKLYPTVSEPPFEEFRVWILRDPRLNAFAYPNGVICVSTGILAAAENEAQIASVLAHEITHFVHRHGLEGYRDLKSSAAFFSTLTIGTGGYGAIFSAVGFAASVTGHSRAMEWEADQWGWEHYIAAGYAPTEAVRIFEHLETFVTEEEIDEPFFFGSHPKLENRIENYEALSSAYLEDHPGATGIIGTERYMPMMRPLLLENAALDLERQAYGRVERNIKRYLEHFPKDAAACFLLGQVAAQRGHLEKAVALYDEGLQFDPQHAELHRALGMTRYEAQDWDRAAHHFETLLRLAPDHPRRGFIEQYLAQCKEHH